jgi:hypothetical protein
MFEKFPYPLGCSGPRTPGRAGGFQCTAGRRLSLSGVQTRTPAGAAAGACRRQGGEHVKCGRCRKTCDRCCVIAEDSSRHSIPSICVIENAYPYQTALPSSKVACPTLHASHTSHVGAAFDRSLSPACARPRVTPLVIDPPSHQRPPGLFKHAASDPRHLRSQVPIAR